MRLIVVVGAEREEGGGERMDEAEERPPALPPDLALMIVLVPKSKSGDAAKASGEAAAEERTITEAAVAVRNLLNWFSFFMLSAVEGFPAGAGVKADTMDTARNARIQVSLTIFELAKLVY